MTLHAMKVFRKIPFVLLLLPLVAAIILYSHLHPLSLPPADNADRIYQIQLLSVPQQREKTLKIEAKLLSEKDSSTSKILDEKVILYVHKDSLSLLLRQGDILLASASLSHSNRGNPYEFDYDTYLLRKGFSGVIFLDENEWFVISHRPINTPSAIADRCRHWFVSHLRLAGLSDDELGIVAAMAVGDRNELPYETRQRFSAAGAAHVLAVSGLHTGVVFFIIMNILTLFGLCPLLYKHKKRRWLVTLLALLFIWLYAFLTGLSPSVMRAALMITIASVGTAAGRDAVSFNTLAAAAFVNLVIEPYALFSVSFCLSYSAVIGILLFYSKIEHILSFSNGLVRKIWQLLAVSVSAWLGTLPATLWFFSQTSNCFAVTNFFVIPLAYLIIIFSILFALFAATPLAAYVALPLKLLARAMNYVVSAIEDLPFSTSNLSITPAILFVFVIALSLLALSIHREKWQWLVSFAASLTIIVILHIAHLKQISESDHTYVYNSYPYSLVLHQHGRTCTVCSDSLDAALQLTEPLRKKQMISQVHTVDLSACEAAAFSINDRRFLLLSPDKGDKLLFRSSLPADILLFAGKGNPSADTALGMTNAAQVVVLSSVPQYRADDIIRTASLQNIPVSTARNCSVEIIL